MKTPIKLLKYPIRKSTNTVIVARKSFSTPREAPKKEAVKEIKNNPNKLFIPSLLILLKDKMRAVLTKGWT